MKKWNDRPPAWNSKTNEDFKKGSKVEGVYSEKREVNTSKGTSMIYTLDKGGGDMVAVWGTKKLDNFFKAMPMGIKVSLTYLGKTELQSGNTFHDFEMEYDEEYRETNKKGLTDEDIDDAIGDIKA